MFLGDRCKYKVTSLVGNSKVMAQRYRTWLLRGSRITLRFDFGNKNIANHLEGEWEKLQMILRDFFYPILQGFN